MMWKPFGEIIPDDANFSKRIESDAFDIKMYSGSTKSLLESLQNRFPDDFNQWDASIRNQFIILGMIAMGREKGEYQGALVHRLGLGSGDVRIKGSNIIRAAKIALARLAKDSNAELFSHQQQATGLNVSTGSRVRSLPKRSKGLLSHILHLFFFHPLVPFDDSRRWFHIVSDI